MLRQVLFAKIHRAVVTGCNRDYVGSIVIDPVLLEATGLVVNEKVLVADCETGTRFETYIFEGRARLRRHRGQRGRGQPDGGRPPPSDHVLRRHDAPGDERAPAAGRRLRRAQRHRRACSATTRPRSVCPIPVEIGHRPPGPIGIHWRIRRLPTRGRSRHGRGDRHATSRSVGPGRGHRGDITGRGPGRVSRGVLRLRPGPPGRRPLAGQPPAGAVSRHVGGAAPRAQRGRHVDRVGHAPRRHGPGRARARRSRSRAVRWRSPCPSRAGPV